MTTPADVRAVEEAFEAALAGRPVPAGVPGLAAFTDAVRAEATGPGRPNAALAELLANGLLPDASPRTAGRPARSSRKRPRMILSTLVAKFAAAGAVAKASVAGGAVAALALTGAVTTDVLSEPDADPAAVESSDPADVVPETTTDPVVDDSASAEDASAEDGGEQAPAADPTDTEDTPDDVVAPVEPLSYDDWIAGPADGQPFGQWVSAGDHEGWTTGALVSCFAQARQGKPGKPTVADCRALASAPADDDGTAEQAPTGEPADADTDAAVEPAPAPTPATSGHGNSGGGNGNSGSGNGNGSGSTGHGNGGGNGGGRR